MDKKHPLSLMVLASLAALAGCTQHTIKTEPIQVEPIHITVDVRVQVDRQLNEFFAFEEQVEQRVEPGPPAPAEPAPEADGPDASGEAESGADTNMETDTEGPSWGGYDSEQADQQPEQEATR